MTFLDDVHETQGIITLQACFFGVQTKWHNMGKKECYVKKVCHQVDAPPCAHSQHHNDISDTHTACTVYIGTDQPQWHALKIQLVQVIFTSKFKPPWESGLNKIAQVFKRQQWGWGDVFGKDLKQLGKHWQRLPTSPSIVLAGGQPLLLVPSLRPCGKSLSEWVSSEIQTQNLSNSQTLPASHHHTGYVYQTLCNSKYLMAMMGYMIYKQNRCHITNVISESPVASYRNITTVNRAALWACSGWTGKLSRLLRALAHDYSW